MVVKARQLRHYLRVKTKDGIIGAIVNIERFVKDRPFHIMCDVDLGDGMVDHCIYGLDELVDIYPLDLDLTNSRARSRLEKMREAFLFQSDHLEKLTATPGSVFFPYDIRGTESREWGGITGRLYINFTTEAVYQLVFSPKGSLINAKKV